MVLVRSLEVETDGADADIGSQGPLPPHAALERHDHKQARQHLEVVGRGWR